MTWTTPADLRAQVQKLWDKGELLRVDGAPMPPLRLRLVAPTSTELAERFDDVRAWMRDLGCHVTGDSAPPYRIAMRTFRHRVLGHNAVPEAVWLDSLDAALALLGKQAEARRFAQLVQTTRTQQPAVLPWLQQRPLQALDLAPVWPRLLAVVAWLQAQPRPGVYLRQVDLPGVDSKFIEAHRGVLASLLDLALPPQAIDASASGASQFARRYGFQDKPLRVRVRWLGAGAVLLPAAAETDQDVTLTQAAFARLALPVRRVFITENEINFLAFPPVADSLLVFGAGYGFDALAAAPWLHSCAVHYWGDIDTHGFAILDQLRAHLPHAQSLLMDRETLLAHTGPWGHEPTPVLRDLPRLTAKEQALFDDLRYRRLGTAPGTACVRLEQERIGFGWVQQALAALPLPISLAGRA
ncbi:MAG: DUF2220 family protein [Hydrogenophaga sp.]|uniref:Wadjet anti-phage system protein JetD domain-containing protein n=1 Tax=Hydrogenophaga sp. TaxID=1904254 RepID=UPI002719B681|nr:Wadjet anti-phage system protein JetD domain-containing protein [Hydrogenophaga sp.]MDO9482480.1 DUF2220 family protein [Hydrogenophaga sp.]MDP3347143.1 DUF2220 family protein [Hydrogenophaga sp.]MDP3806278.1 DUF2220 family protein [Hydrogenophaga sp.]